MAKTSKQDGTKEVRTYDTKEETDRALEQMEESGSHGQIQTDDYTIEIDHEDREELLQQEREIFGE